MDRCCNSHGDYALYLGLSLHRARVVSSAFYGKIPNSRGGVSRTACFHRYCSQDTQPQEPQEEANRFQDWRNVADLTRRPGSVRRSAKEHRQIRINSFILSVAESAPVVSQAPSDDSCSRYLIAYSSLKRRASQWQRVDGRAI